MQEFFTVKRRQGKRMIPEEVRSSTYFPVLSFDEEEGLFITEDNCLCFAFSCHPLSGMDNTIEQQVVTLLNEDFPANSQMQVINFRSPDIVRHMNRMLTMREKHFDPLLNTVMQERSHFLGQHSNDKLIIENTRGRYNLGYIFDLKVLITVKVPFNGDLPSHKETLNISTLKTKIKTTLQNIKVHPIDVDANEWLRIMGSMLNWGDTASWRNNVNDWDKEDMLCNQVMDLDNDIEINKDHIRMGKTYVKCLSAKRRPKQIYFGEAMSNIGDFSGGSGGMKHNCMIVTNVVFPDIDKAKDKLEKQRQWAIKTGQGPMVTVAPVLAEKKKDFEMIHDSISDGKKPIKMSYHVIVFGESIDDVETAATTARNFWRTNRFEIMVDKFVQMPILLNCLPFGCDADAIQDLQRHKTLTAKEGVAFLPLFGEWKGTGTPHLNLISRNGQLMNFSLHDTDSNMNAVIAAQSGSGKSFLTNEVIVSYMSEGAQVWVLDAGKSYKKLSSVLEGDFVQFDENTQVCLNPFPLIENYKEDEDGIVGLVKAMASPKGKITEYQESALKQIIGEMWDKHGKKLIVDFIAEACKEHNDPRVKDLGQQLFPFTSNGSYGKYFVGENNVTFQNAFSVVELDELNGRTHLRQVVLLQLIYQIQQNVFMGDRNRKKIVIVDEAWDLLKEGEVSVFMEHAYRKFRKYGGSMIICTQSLNDLYDNKVGRAIAENSSTTMQLGQKNETINSLKRDGRIDLDEFGFNQLRTVHTTKGVYSEIYVKSENGGGVARLIVNDFQKLLYSTDSTDVQDIEIREKQGMSTQEAINDVLQQRRNLLQGKAA